MTVAALVMIATITTTQHLKGLILRHVEHGGVGRHVVHAHRPIMVGLVMALAGSGGR